MPSFGVDAFLVGVPTGYAFQKASHLEHKRLARLVGLVVALYVFVRIPFWIDNVPDTGDAKKDKAVETAYDFLRSSIRASVASIVLVVGGIAILVT